MCRQIVEKEVSFIIFMARYWRSKGGVFDLFLLGNMMCGLVKSDVLVFGFGCSS